QNKAAAAVGLKAAVRILEKWRASGEQGEAILRVSHSTYARARRGDLVEIKLDSDQLTRISYVLNIHATLRMIFDNPDNLYGFVNLV
ncbi:antitoxin Xre-like helix-turn-helix domain-containing protein, partial [Burkholderia sp. SIMBA_057]